VAFARIELRLSLAEFYASTPRQFDAMARAHRRARRREVQHIEFLFGQLTAMVANTGFRGWKEVRTTDEFMPSRHKGKVAKPKRINRQAVAKKLRENMAWLMAQQNKQGSA
jgi:hypothetical protein